MQLRASKLFSNESESIVHAAVRARVAVSVALALLLPSVYFPSSVLVTRMCLISPLALFAVKEVQVNTSVRVSGRNISACQSLSRPLASKGVADVSSYFRV